MLEFDDIQHILLTRTPAITGRYEFLSFDTPAGGRAWLTELLDKTLGAMKIAREGAVTDWSLVTSLVKRAKDMPGIADAAAKIANEKVAPALGWVRNDKGNDAGSVRRVA